MIDDPRVVQYAAERDEAIEIAHRAMLAGYQGPPPKLRGDAERMVALICAGWVPAGAVAELQGRIDAALEEVDTLAGIAAIDGVPGVFAAAARRIRRALTMEEA